MWDRVLHQRRQCWRQSLLGRAGSAETPPKGSGRGARGTPGTGFVRWGISPSGDTQAAGSLSHRSQARGAPPVPPPGAVLRRSRCQTSASAPRSAAGAGKGGAVRVHRSHASPLAPPRRPGHGTGNSPGLRGRASSRVCPGPQGEPAQPRRPRSCRRGPSVPQAGTDPVAANRPPPPGRQAQGKYVQPQPSRRYVTGPGLSAGALRAGEGSAPAASSPRGGCGSQRKPSGAGTRSGGRERQRRRRC